MEPVVLEDWIQLASSSPSSVSTNLSPATDSAPEFAASAIVHAWAQVRACVQRKALNASDAAALDLLNRHRRSLLLADSQAKLLQALLTEVAASDYAILGRARRFAVLGLLAWIRKCYTVNGANSSSMIRAPDTLASLVDRLRKAMEERSVSDQYTCEGILLLGTISSLEYVQPQLSSDCLATIAVELRDRKEVIVRGAIVDALAGAGLALSVATKEHVAPILRALLLLWTPPPSANVRESSAERVASEAGESKGLGAPVSIVNSKAGQSEGDGAIVKDVVKLLHLMDYLGSIFLSSSRTESTTPIEQIRDALLGELHHNNANCAVQCATIMASVGLLRSFYRWGEGHKKHGNVTPIEHKRFEILASLETLVIQISEQAIIPDMGIRDVGIFHGGSPPPVASLQLCRCVSVAVSRCRRLPVHPAVLRCLLTCIFSDTLGLDTLYSALVAELATQLPEIKNPSSSSQEEGNLLPGEPDVGELKVHVDSIAFQELGGITRAMCDQYCGISRDLQAQTEHLVADYCRNLYQRHRLLLATPRKTLWLGWPQYRQLLEKVLQAAFITVVVFLSSVVKEHVSDEHKSSVVGLTALALDSLACVEYFRHVQLRGFSKVIQRCVSQISGSEDDAVTLAHLIPSYEEVLQNPGASDGNLSYSWAQDEVQTGRILFYFRVLPICLSKMPEATFATEIAPLMFLYMQHPSESVSKATHALFAAFLALGERSGLTVKFDAVNPHKSNISGAETKATMTLGEQLVEFYMQKALQEFPGVTPFHGLVAGVGAIAKYLPPGSPATVHCLKCLVDKAGNLYKTNTNSRNDEEASSETQENLSEETDNKQKQLPEEIAAAQKLQLLLLHLVLIVDIQVFPVLLKLVAKLILGLPHEFQTPALVEAFDVVGGTDDYTRKPVIVPWLQSLSYLVYDNQSRYNLVEFEKQGNGAQETSSVNVPSCVTESTQSPETGNEGKDEKPEHATQETTEDEKRVPSTEIIAERDNDNAIAVNKCLAYEGPEGEEKIEDRCYDHALIRSKL